MKRTLIGCAMVAALVAGCGEPFLIYQDQIPDFKAPADKALCVVLRSQGGIGYLRAEATLWLDGKVVGGTGPNTMSSFEVPAGEHLLFVRMNLSPMQAMVRIPGKIKFNFQPGKIYFVMQAIYPIGVGVGTSLVAMPGDEAMAKIQQEKSSSKYALRNAANTDAKDMSDSDAKDALDDWKKWSEDPKNAADVKKETEYPGY